MQNIIKIVNQEITVKEYKGQRVVTFRDIDLCHERPEGTARKRFNDNRKHFIEGEDYFKVCASEIRTHKIVDISNKSHEDVTLITQQGYMMLAKSLTDDLAWAVQRELVNSYFSRPEKPVSAMELLETQFKALKEVDAKVESVKSELDEFKQEMPILGVEEVKITNAVKKKGVECLGGKSAAAYGDRSLRSKLYADIYRQLKREFGVTSYKAIPRGQCDRAIEIVERYTMPYVIEEAVISLNGQIAI
ncbi:MAG: hypothetical protein HFE76_14125 [Firmicutes bacterium]|nr:hypothetical protein [Bacillota bacterium]